jgi:3-phenylpropionate/trans-cinnamate dioxygenase ferredoxin reductase subunit
VPGGGSAHRERFEALVTSPERIVVVGASQAGCGCAAELRRLGFDGSITVVGDESHPPYARPPLSKGVLTGAESEESVFLPVPEGVEMLRGSAATGLDAVRGLVVLEDGSRLPYDGLVVATGARARRLVPHGHNSEFTLRGLDDALELRKRFAAIRDVAVAGGGFLGMEIASAAASLGKNVTVIDQVAPLLGRLGPLLSTLLLEAAADHGVRVQVSGQGIGVGFSNGVADRLVAADGTLLVEADIAVTAVGDVPNTEWLRGSGLPLEGGLVVDADCRAAPGIVGVGDAVAQRNPDGRAVRTPHWSNALFQAPIAAATLIGRERDRLTRDVLPFFWTEAFGLKIRFSGQLPPVGEPRVIDGSIAQRRALLVWDEAGQGSGLGTAAAVNFPISAPKLARLA